MHSNGIQLIVFDDWSPGEPKSLDRNSHVEQAHCSLGRFEEKCCRGIVLRFSARIDMDEQALHRATLSNQLIEC